MKNLKYGITALCGSLVALTGAEAGDLTVKGTANATWVGLDSGVNSGGVTTGNPLGMKSNLTFTGSGELDAGQNFSASIYHTDQNVWSSSNITLTMNRIGTFKLSAAEGAAGIDGYDDKTPNAFEEVWDAGVGTGTDMISGVGLSTSISWTSPSIMGGSNIQLAYAPRNDGSQPTDKGSGGTKNENLGAGGDVVIDINPDLLMYIPNIFVGVSATDRNVSGDAVNLDSGKDGNTPNNAESNTIGEAVAGVIWGIGPVKVGYQQSAEYLGLKGAAETDYYDSTSWGVSFNVNDDLSVSYGEWESERNFHGSSVNEAVEISGDSMQVAYTMGGVSIKLAETDVNNKNYTLNNDVGGTLLSLTLAF
jgi:hypothetical protein